MQQLHSDLWVTESPLRFLGLEVGARASAFRWIRGEDRFRSYGAPPRREPPPYRRDFCCECGSPLPVVRPGAPYFVLQAGSLDDDVELRPLRHIFTAQRAPWFEIRDGLPSFEGQPPADQRLPTGASGATSES